MAGAYDRLKEFPLGAEASRELQEKVKAKWPDLLRLLPPIVQLEAK